MLKNTQHLCEFWISAPLHLYVFHLLKRQKKSWEHGLEYKLSLLPRNFFNSLQRLSCTGTAWKYLKYSADLYTILLPCARYSAHGVRWWQRATSFPTATLQLQVTSQTKSCVALCLPGRIWVFVVILEHGAETLAAGLGHSFSSVRGPFL